MAKRPLGKGLRALIRDKEPKKKKGKRSGPDMDIDENALKKWAEKKAKEKLALSREKKDESILVNEESIMDEMESEMEDTLKAKNVSEKEIQRQKADALEAYRTLVGKFLQSDPEATAGGREKKENIEEWEEVEYVEDGEEELVELEAVEEEEEKEDPKAVYERLLKKMKKR